MRAGAGLRTESEASLSSQEGATEAEGGHIHNPSLGSSFGGGEKLLEESLLMVVPCHMVQVGTWGQGVEAVAAGHLLRQHQIGL